MTIKRGNLFVIVAPSGSGKSTLIKKLKADFPQIKESISCTTRQRREGEEDGIHYFFTSVDDFEKKLEQNAFLEWAKVHENYYGTSKNFVDESLAQGQNLLFDIDVQGIDKLIDIYGKEEIIGIFIAPPSIKELENRLRGRGTDNIETILKRLNNAKHEILRKNDYTYCIVNDDLETAYSELKDIVSKNIL